MINTKIEINHFGFCGLDMTISNNSDNIFLLVVGAIELSINDEDKFDSSAKARFKEEWLNLEIGESFRLNLGSHIIDVAIFDDSK